MSNSLDALAGNPVAELPDLNERVRLRSRFGISQTKLAATLGVTRKTVYAWENGKSEPTGENRERYAEILALWATREHEVQGK